MKLATRYYADPKVAGLPDEASEMMFVRGLARAGEEGREGFIPESALPELARRRRYAACVDTLVAAGLWSRVNGGYQITRWADWQDGLDALARRRTADRERQRRRRAAAGPTSRDNEEPSRDSFYLSRDESRDVTDAESDQDLDTSLTSSNYLQEPVDNSDDDVPAAVWNSYAQLKLDRQPTGKVGNPDSYKRTTIENARAEHGETALRWWREFDVRPHVLAAWLIDGQPSRNAQRRKENA